MTPAILETTKALAGIANAERITEANKKLANELLEKMLNVLKTDVDAAYHKEIGIFTPIPGQS
jgi:hypothetical protein